MCVFVFEIYRVLTSIFVTWGMVPGRDACLLCWQLCDGPVGRAMTLGKVQMLAGRDPKPPQTELERL